jgi:outer membrane protein assembly factor BamE (lipoprotein component of BamABCDE complex)
MAVPEADALTSCEHPPNAPALDRDPSRVYVEVMIKTHFIVLAVICCVLTGCEAPYHGRAVQQGMAEGDRLTVAAVQREVARGMSGSQVLEALGSPNIISTDEHGREVWVYDKFATDVVTSGSSWFVTAGAASRTQRTLTVIIKYDEDKRVRDIAYHSSRF